MRCGGEQVARGFGFATAWHHAHAWAAQSCEIDADRALMITVQSSPRSGRHRPTEGGCAGAHCGRAYRAHHRF